MYLLGKDDDEVDDEVDASNTLADIVPALAPRTFVGGRWGSGALGSLLCYPIS
jgi:hypothetical protein